MKTARDVIPGFGDFMDELAERLDEEPKRECPSCPPWVVACAHWDGLVLALTDIRELGHPLVDDGPFSVRLAPPFDDAACPCHGERWRGGEDDGMAFSDLPSAQAEFDRRAAELLKS